jgi:hypothetical protein
MSAPSCAKAGIPVMLEQDNTGKFFVLMPPKDKQSLPDDITSKKDNEVTVTGHEYLRVCHGSALAELLR